MKISGRCRSCNTVLTDEEMVYRHPDTEQYADMCFRCCNLSSEGEDEFDDLFEEHKDELWEPL